MNGLGDVGIVICFLVVVAIVVVARLVVVVGFVVVVVGLVVGLVVVVVVDLTVVDVVGCVIGIHCGTFLGKSQNSTLGLKYSPGEQDTLTGVPRPHI